MPRRFYQKNNFEGSLFSFTKSAVLSHFKIGGFVSLSKSAVLSHLKSAVLSCPPKLQSNIKSNCTNCRPDEANATTYCSVMVWNQPHKELKLKYSSRWNEILPTRKIPGRFWGNSEKGLRYLAAENTRVRNIVFWSASFMFFELLWTPCCFLEFSKFYMKRQLVLRRGSSNFGRSWFFAWTWYFVQIAASAVLSIDK